MQKRVKVPGSSIQVFFWMQELSEGNNLILTNIVVDGKAFVLLPSSTTLVEFPQDILRGLIFLTALEKSKEVTPELPEI